MKEVHAALPITGIEYDFFNQQIIDVLESAGVASADRTFVLELLNSPDVRGAICNFGDGCFDSICNKYSKLLKKSNQDLIAAVVDAAFGAVVADPLQVPFFNGTKPPGSTNFFMNAAKLTKLKADFGAFLGRADVLGCSNVTFPVANIDIAGLKAVHAAMPIDTAVFNAFNDDVHPRHHAARPRCGRPGHDPPCAQLDRAADLQPAGLLGDQQQRHQGV
jgi:hypothetical protein